MSSKELQAPHFSRERPLGASPAIVLDLLLGVVVLSLGDLMEIIPLFAPLVASPLFHFFHEIHDLLTVGLVLYAAYKYRARLGIVAILVYIATHIPYFIVQSPENAPEFLRILSSGFVAIFGIWLISRLRKSEEQWKASQETLRQSEEKYRGLVGNVRLGIFRSTPVPTGRFLEVNRAMEEITGYSREELLRMNVSDLYLHPEERQAVIEEIASAQENITKELNFRKKDGAEIAVSDIKTPVKDDTGKILYFDGVMEDVTERKLAEERIAHLTTVLRAIRNVNQLITHEKDRQSLIQKSCDLLVQRQGYERAWILLLDDNRNFVTAVSTGLREHDLAFLKQLETGDYPVCVRELLGQEQLFLVYDQPGKRHEGCILASEHSRQGVFRCKLEHGGKLYGVLGVAVPSGTVFDKEEQALFLELCSDVAFALANIEAEKRRKQAEEATQRTEENFRRSLDDSPLGIRIVSADGETVYANRAILDFYGYDSIEELKTTPREKSYTQESYAEHQVRKEKRQRDEYVPSNYEIGIVRKDGEIRHLLVFRKEVTWDGKRQFQVIYQDITERKRAEEKVVHLASFPELNPNLVLELDQKGNLRYLNPAARSCFPDMATLGMNHPFLADWVQVVKQLQSSNGTKSITREVVVDSSFYEQIIFPVSENQIRVYGTNITERKRAEREIKREKAFSADIVATVPESLLVVDGDSRIKSTNRAFNELFQTEPEKVTGRKIADVLGDKDGKLSAQLARLFKTEDTLEDFELHYQSEKLGERILNITARGMIVAEEEEEEEEELLVVIQDITERKQMEEELRHSGEFFKTVFNSNTDATSVIDVHDFTIVRANDAFLQQYGLKEEQVIGKTCYQITHHRSDPCIPPEDICPLRDTVTTEEHSVAEHVHYTKDNERIYVEVSISPIKDEDGKVMQVVHVSKDITERKKMHEQLMSQDRLASIGQLVSGVAHEINNPLTGVIGFSELLLKRDLPDDVKADLKIVNDEAMRTAKIVKNLLTFARKQPEGKAPVDIHEQIQRVLDLRDHEQKVNNIQVITRFASDLPQVMGNASQLQQVFFNIVINAEFFMLEAHQKGNLTITTERTGDIVRASFTDDGPGISDKSMKSLFTPFFTTKEVGKGTGLGLSICHGIVTEHGGRIYAESEPGKGTTFIVELSIKEETTGQEEAR